ncbi:MAG: DEAD/DEAH box helicase family protein, partial [Mogibacterium sp.]|nr:DEAD/DEAH box helicase family protein [Mogibacterium sp.]
MNDNIINVEYEANGNSTKINQMGMREMQEKAYAARNAQYLLLKAPPASGKSRALMFIALAKLRTGSVKKVIVAVPERSIGSSFKDTKLTENGFHSDWKVNGTYNLCLPGGENSK